jgi:hypothetical protein
VAVPPPLSFSKILLSLFTFYRAQLDISSTAKIFFRIISLGFFPNLSLQSYFTLLYAIFSNLDLSTPKNMQVALNCICWMAVGWLPGSGSNPYPIQHERRHHFPECSSIHTNHALPASAFETEIFSLSSSQYSSFNRSTLSLLLKILFFCIFSRYQHSSCIYTMPNVSNSSEHEILIKLWVPCKWVFCVKWVTLNNAPFYQHNVRRILPIHEHVPIPLPFHTHMTVEMVNLSFILSITWAKESGLTEMKANIFLVRKGLWL